MLGWFTAAHLEVWIQISLWRQPGKPFVWPRAKLLHVSETFLLCIVWSWATAAICIHNNVVRKFSFRVFERFRAIWFFFILDYEDEDARESPYLWRFIAARRRSSLKYEPLADEKWTRLYEKKVKENEEVERIHLLDKRINGTERVDSW